MTVSDLRSAPECKPSADEWRSRRTLTRRIAISICLGFIATVAVDILARNLVPTRQKLVAARKLSGVFRQVSATGVEFAGVHQRLFAADHITATSSTQSSLVPLPSGDPPQWVETDGGPLHASGRYFEMEAFAFGWPMRSSVSETYTDMLRFDGTTRIARARGELWFVQGQAERPKVLRLRAAAVVANTFFFAVIVWTSLLASATFRRARRRVRQLCVSCGYLLPSSGLCPECGTASRASGAQVAQRQKVT